MKILKSVFPVVVSLLVLISCQNEGDPVPVNSSIEDELSKSEKARPKTVVWSDDILYGSVVTPAVFDGDKGNYDKLYAGSFKDGVALISESKPGDQDYNGGRWNLYVAKEGVATDYSMATSDGDLNLMDFESAGTYFECPLLPRKNKN